MVGTQLKSIRIKKSYTQKEAAKLISITPEYLSSIENNRNDVTIKLLERFCKAYDVTFNISI